MDTTHIIHYRHGHVYKISPEPIGSYGDNRDIVYSATTICSDGIFYHLADKDTIHSIAIPKFKSFSVIEGHEMGVTGNLDYDLRMISGAFEREKREDLALACLEKATQLMAYSDIAWRYSDYFRIVYWLEKRGNFAYAEKWEKWINKHVKSPNQASLEIFQSRIEEAKKAGTDLVYFSWSEGQCGAIAKYQGRIYSISGTHRDFPPLPTFFFRQGCVVPPSGGCIGGPFFWYKGRKNPILDAVWYKGKYVPAKKASWRPWRDDRSPQEKQEYLIRAEKAYRRELFDENCRIMYRLHGALPESAPKTFETLLRWETTKPEKYLYVLKRAKELGLEMPKKITTQPIIEEPDDPDPNYRGKRK